MEGKQVKKEISQDNFNVCAQNYIAKKVNEVHSIRKLPEFRSGDLICVHTVIIEGSKRRIQKFEGRCIGRRGGGLDASYTVWAVMHDVGVRRTFPLYACDVEVIRRGKVRRDKLNYFTELRGKKARIKDRRVK
jgi:large subunit ribosomal protein L19